MRDKDVIKRIDDLRKEHGWTYYRLAVEAGMPYSTLNNMIHRHNIPSIPTLQKICDALNISLGDFFADQGAGKLSKQNQELVDLYSNMKKDDKELFLEVMKEKVQK